MAARKCCASRRARSVSSTSLCELDRCPVARAGEFSPSTTTLISTSSDDMGELLSSGLNQRQEADNGGRHVLSAAAERAGHGNPDRDSSRRSASRPITNSSSGVAAVVALDTASYWIKIGM